MRRMTRTADNLGQRVVLARWICPCDGPVISSGYVAVAEGRIRAIGEGRPAHPLGPVEDFGDAAILPGFVNAHTHLGCGFLKGMESGENFVDWMTRGVAPRVIAAAREHPEEIAAGARIAARECLEGGMTTLVDSFFRDDGLVAMRAEGQKGHFCREVFGASATDLDLYVREARVNLEKEVADFGAGSVRFGIAPHAPYTAPQAVLTMCADLARRTGSLVTIHVAESIEECRMFAAGEGPMFEIFANGDRRERYRLGRSSLGACDEAGLLSPRTLVVHAVHLTDDDIAIVARSGAHLVHCPSSNRQLAVGTAPIAKWRAAGINVALGTDSAASNGKLDMFEEMRTMIAEQRLHYGTVVTPDEALAMATIGGARAVGRESEIGSLSVGKAADLAVVDLSRARHRPVRDPIRTVVMSAVPTDVRAVMIDGAWAYRSSGA